MSDLTVVATIEAKPNGVDDVRSALCALAVSSRDDDGCIAYELSESASAPGTFVTVETWRSREDLDKHLQSDHVRNAFATTGDLLAAPPTIHPLNPVTL